MNNRHGSEMRGLNVISVKKPPPISLFDYLVNGAVYRRVLSKHLGRQKV